MGQKKKNHHSKPHVSMPYAEKQKAIRQMYVQASCDIYCQFVFDMAVLVLHQKYGFGRKRLEAFAKELFDAQALFHSMLSEDQESGYLRDRLDAMLKEIYGEDLVPFERRYDWVKNSKLI